MDDLLPNRELVEPSGTPGTLSPGANATESIPARGPTRDFTPDERAGINSIGNTSGCHTCGTKSPGTKSGNWIPDHQPPNGLNKSGGPQESYTRIARLAVTDK